MADVSPKSSRPQPPDPFAAAPEVALEVRLGGGAPVGYAVGEGGFLIGSIPGCDLRVPGANLPPLFCSMALCEGGLALRELNASTPILVNGQPISAGLVRDGDKLTVAGVEIVIQGQPTRQGMSPVLENTRQQLDQQLKNLKSEVLRFQKHREAVDKSLKERETRLKDAAADLEKDRVAWNERRQQIEQECQQHQESAAVLHRDHIERPAAELEAKKQELIGLRKELADLRTQLYDRYRDRRDRLTAQEEAVNKAAHKVQERKRAVDEEQKQFESRKQAFETFAAEGEAKQRELEAARADLETRDRELRQELGQRLADVQAREEQLLRERTAMEEQQALLRDDLVRMERRQGTLDLREQDVLKRSRDCDERGLALQRDTHDLEEQVKQLDEWHSRICDLGERLGVQKTEQEQAARDQAQRAAQLEGQQTTLAGLRTRLEQMKEECQRDAKSLSEQRAQQETLETDLQARLAETRKLKEELDQENHVREADRRQFSERGANLDLAVANLRQAQEKLTADEQQIKQRETELDTRAAEQAEKASFLEARLAQYEDLQRRLEAERANVLERSRLLAQAEQAREALQEQLRRRSEELSQRQKSLAEHQVQHDQALAAIEERRADVERHLERERSAVAQLRKEIDLQGRDLDRQASDVKQREAKFEELSQRVKDMGREVAKERKLLAQERTDLTLKKQQSAEEIGQAKTALSAVQREVKEMQRQVPDLELKAGAALERLTHARELLREHLGEVHQFARKCQEDLEGLRGQVVTEAERVQQRELALRRQQDEHRLAVTDFRQHLLDWQGQLAEMKRLLATDQSRLQRKQVEVEREAKRLDEDSQKLARATEELNVEKQTVAEHRQEVDRHLEDMRDWYCRKLRELAGLPEGAEVLATPASGGTRDILSLTGELDPADRHLGELLKKFGLVQADALQALWREARRQRRSLRQVLLASNVVTLYQLALIEAGNLDALMLGPVRVIDRLRITPREAVYRVFDPRRGQEMVLRHLAEAELSDPIHPDEFRQRFHQAMLDHPHLVAPLDTFDVAGRPAALFEWLTGLASPDWPPLAAAPGVCFRLLSQAALGLHALHDAGLAHGHLEAGHMILTGAGLLKLCGVGEPLWLPHPAPQNPADDPAADLRALGEIAANWCAAGVRKGAKVKALPPEMLAILDRLCSPDDDAFPSAAALLEELDRISDSIPPNPEAWDRLVKHVRDNAAAGASLRLSA